MTVTKSLKSFTLVTDHYDRNEEWLNEENLSQNDEKESNCESSTNEICNILNTVIILYKDKKYFRF